MHEIEGGGEWGLGGRVGGRDEVRGGCEEGGGDNLNKLLTIMKMWLST